MSEILKKPSYEKEETMVILEKRGFSKKDAETIANVYAKNPEYWADFMMNYELELSNPTNENALRTAAATAAAFVIFGFIPLIPYVFMRSMPHLFATSCAFTLVAFVFLGMLRWKVTKQPFFRSVGEIVFIGSVSATIAYIVGSFFKI